MGLRRRRGALVTVLAVGDVTAYIKKAKTYAGLTNIWPQAEDANDIIDSWHGTPANVVFGAAGISAKDLAATYNGTTSRTALAHNAAFNGNSGTLIAWAKVSAAGVWTDGAYRFVALFYGDGAGANRIDIWRNGATGGGLSYRRTAAGIAKTISYTTASPTTFMCLGMTWDTAAGADGQLMAYYNGAQVGATQTGIGTFTGPLNATNTGIGAAAASNQVWSGPIGPVLLYNIALAPAAMADLAVVPS